MHLLCKRLVSLSKAAVGKETASAGGSGLGATSGGSRLMATAGGPPSTSSWKGMSTSTPFMLGPKNRENDIPNYEAFADVDEVK